MAMTDAVLQEMIDEFQLRKLAHTYCRAVDRGDVIVGGRYLDRYEKRDDTWRVVEQTIGTDGAMKKDPSSMDLIHPIMKDTLKGTLDGDDPSYRFFSLNIARRR